MYTSILEDYSLKYLNFKFYNLVDKHQINKFRYFIKSIHIAKINIYIETANQTILTVCQYQKSEICLLVVLFFTGH